MSNPLVDFVVLRFDIICPTAAHSSIFLCACFQSAQNLAQISDLQAQLEEALKEKQDIQEKVNACFLFLV